MSTIKNRLFADVFNDVRAIGLLNDIQDDIFNNDRLLPHANLTYMEIQDEFAAHGIPFAETTTTSLTYAANATTIVVPGGITDLAVPIEIWEKGTSDTRWIPMQRVANLRAPLESSRDILGEWEWRNGTIVVLACSTARDIFCRYRRQLAYPTAVTAVGFDGIYRALVAGVAMRAATNRPESQKAAALEYATALSRAVHIASRERQGIVYQQGSWRGRARAPITFEQ